jgi:hypothetical protein
MLAKISSKTETIARALPKNLFAIPLRNINFELNTRKVTNTRKYQRFIF